MDNSRTCILKGWQHSHDFSHNNLTGERRIRYVLFLTVITMFVEIVAGNIYGSMALVAHGWHMGTHAAVFLITLFTYYYSRKNSNNESFSFGTGKVNTLGGFASAMALTIVAFVMFVESVHRIAEPHLIIYNKSMLVATIGLTINLISAFLLRGNYSHSRHQYSHHHKDHNLKAAYLHVLADALTSIFAIVALMLGKYFGLNWMDPLAGIVGAIIITKWSLGLLKQTIPVLLDSSVSEEYRNKIKQAIEFDSADRVCDLHVWEVGSNHYAAIISIVTKENKKPVEIKSLLKKFKKLSHISIEINSVK